jgi:hypothetical protein
LGSENNALFSRLLAYILCLYYAEQTNRRIVITLLLIFLFTHLSVEDMTDNKLHADRVICTTT